MKQSTPPTAFISHASEDKERFVTAFAIALRSAGVDAWYDTWEIGPGDSLVTRIFDEGLAGADAFIVVLSKVSVTKPWVKEELDSAVVRRIQSGQVRRVIPVVLDEGIDVPHSLQHLLWESVPRLGTEGVVDRIASALLNRSARPPLGMPPSYTDTPVTWSAAPADEAVFRLVVDEVRDHDSYGWQLTSDDVGARAQALGMSTAQYEECMTALEASGLIRIQGFLGGTRWRILPFDDDVWLALERERGVDVDHFARRVLAAIVNDGCTSFAAADFGVGHHLLGGVLRQFRSTRLLANVHEVNGGQFVVSGISPLAARALRDFKTDP